MFVPNHLQVPLSKLGRVKRIVRPSLVTLPKFVQDEEKYKTVLKQIGRLNGILPDNPQLGVHKKDEKQANSALPDKRGLVSGREASRRADCTSKELSRGKPQSPKTAVVPPDAVPSSDGASTPNGSGRRKPGATVSSTKDLGVGVDESSCSIEEAGGNDGGLADGRNYEGLHDAVHVLDESSSSKVPQRKPKLAPSRSYTFPPLGTKSFSAPGRFKR